MLLGRDHGWGAPSALLGFLLLKPKVLPWALAGLRLWRWIGANAPNKIVKNLKCARSVLRSLEFACGGGSSAVEDAALGAAGARRDRLAANASSRGIQWSPGGGRNRCRKSLVINRLPR
jgi:hypothetical protein